MKQLTEQRKNEVRSELNGITLKINQSRKKCGMPKENGSPCQSAAKYERVWGNQTIYGCKKHIDLWDETVTNALLGWPDEE